MGCFRPYLFVRAFLAKPLTLRHRKAVRNLSSRFELDPSTVARVAGARSLFCFVFLEWVRRFPGFLCMRSTLYVRTGKKMPVFFALSNEHTAQDIHTPQVDNSTCREHDVTTLPPISISTQHRACVTRPSALYCCGYSSCFHRSLRSVIHHLYPCLCCCCDRSTLTEM